MPKNNILPRESSADDSSESDSEENLGHWNEKDPTEVPFQFVKTGMSCFLVVVVMVWNGAGGPAAKLSFLLYFFQGKSKREGVLVTHGMFKFQKNNASRDLSTWWYTCACKISHGCNARAIVKREEFTGEDGELYVRNTLVEVATPEVQSWKYFHKFHTSCLFRLMHDSMLPTRLTSSPRSWLSRWKSWLTKTLQLLSVCGGIFTLSNVMQHLGWVLLLISPFWSFHPLPFLPHISHLIHINMKNQWARAVWIILIFIHCMLNI